MIGDHLLIFNNDTTIAFFRHKKLPINNQLYSAFADLLPLTRQGVSHFSPQKCVLLHQTIYSPASLYGGNLQWGLGNWVPAPSDIHKKSNDLHRRVPLKILHCWPFGHGSTPIHGPSQPGSVLSPCQEIRSRISHSLTTLSKTPLCAASYPALRIWKGLLRSICSITYYSAFKDFNNVLFYNTYQSLTRDI